MNYITYRMETPNPNIRKKMGVVETFQPISDFNNFLAFNRQIRSLWRAIQHKICGQLCNGHQVSPKESLNVHPWRFTAGTCPHGSLEDHVPFFSWVICRWTSRQSSRVYRIRKNKVNSNTSISSGEHHIAVLEIDRWKHQQKCPVRHGGGDSQEAWKGDCSWHL